MFTIPSQVLTVTEKPKTEETEKVEQNFNTTIVVSGNLSEIMSNALNQALKAEDSSVENQTKEINVSTESLKFKKGKKFFVYANTTIGLEDEPLPISLDISNLLKHFKDIGFTCFVILDSNVAPKTFRNSATLEHHISKLSIESYLSYESGIRNVLRLIKAK